MVELPVPRPEIISRLKRIEGQLRGIQNMVASERDCIDILIQLSAVKSGLESVAGKVLRNYVEICLQEGDNREKGAALARAVSMWIGGGKKL
jgi:DNA-binding FrmR family transcriptional regulator